MKRFALSAIVLMALFLVACDKPGTKTDPVPTPNPEQVPEPRPDAVPPQEAPGQVDQVTVMPNDSDEAILRIQNVEQRRAGQTYFLAFDEGVWSTFDPNVKIAGVYPVFTELECEYRPNGIFCAYGRMGEITDLQLSSVVPYILNRDLIRLASDLRCSQFVCINDIGQLVGAIQPEMKEWMTLHCLATPEGRLSCD